VAENQSKNVCKCRVKKVRLFDADLGVWVAKLPTGDFLRGEVEELGATSRRLALHWSLYWWFMDKM
jgi:hypothetical protein